MKKKTLITIPILFYSGFSMAAMYVNQDVVEAKGSYQNSISEAQHKQSNYRNNGYENAGKERFSNNIQSSHGGDNHHPHNANQNNGRYNQNVHKDYRDNQSRAMNYDNSDFTSGLPKSPNEVRHTDEIYAQMDTGFLSNSMRKHLNKLGWELRWTAGSDRKITVPYVIKHTDVVSYVEKVSELYGVFVDVYPENKTVHVSK